jgi:hypothetical protein
LSFAVLSRFEVFQQSKRFYKECKRLKLPGFLLDQLTRASSSLGSLRECQAILEIENIDNPALLELADRIGAMLFKLSRPRNREN